MKSLRIFILAFVLLVVGMSQLFACDTNLFSIIAGNTKETAFIESSTKLALAAKTLNENAKKADAAQKLEELMNSWLEFSNKYVVFPPEWGKNDENWKAKFSDLSSILGDIRKYLGKDYFHAHAEIMRFSRRISKLYEKMPRSDEASLLLNLTYDIDKLWLLVEKEDGKSVNSFANNLLQSCEALKKAFYKNHKFKIQDIEDRVKNIIKYSEKQEFATFQINVLVRKLEDDLIQLNQEISDLNAQTNKGQIDK